MIRYSLTCKKTHTFEAWFQSSAAYDRQIKRGLVECPTCGTTKVEKALMAPRIGKGKVGRPAPSPVESEATVPAQASKPSCGPPDPAHVLDMMRKLRREVVSKADYVGQRFAEEARKIHHNEAPQRGIYGEASADDVRALHEDGVECYPLPTLPEDHN